MVLELMGRYAGWIALMSGVAGGADVILIPEIPWNIEAVARKILDRKRNGKPFSIVVVAEGTPDPEGNPVIKRRIEESHEPIRLGGIGQLVGDLIEEHTGIETRVTVLGHIQRGGSPSPYDRVLATMLGVAAAERALRGEWGVMVTLKDAEIQAVPFEDIAPGAKLVSPDHRAGLGRPGLRHLFRRRVDGLDGRHVEPATNKRARCQKSRAFPLGRSLPFRFR